MQILVAAESMKVSYSNKTPVPADRVSVTQTLLLPAAVMISIGTPDVFPGYLEVHKHKVKHPADLR